MESDASISSEDKSGALTALQKRNLLFLLLGYASLMSSTTMVIGTASTLVIGVGGAPQLAPIALACFFMGSAVVSRFQLFEGGRRRGFLTGNLVGLVGAGLGAISVLLSSQGISAAAIWVLLVSYVPLGASNGIGLCLRFAAGEVVPLSKRALAITLVLSGGVVAAFSGPESAAMLQTMMNDNHAKYFGFFAMIAVWNILMASFVSAVKFPTESETEAQEETHEEEKPSLFSLVMKRSFVVPALLSALSWAIMAMPMSVVVLSMSEVDFTSRQSTWAIELHFLGMFAPGVFLTKVLLEKLGTFGSLWGAWVLFVISLLVDLLNERDREWTWYLGMFLVGAAWNIGFAAATVLLMSTDHGNVKKAHIQAANEFWMFSIAGALIVSTGYLYEWGGREISGWRRVHYFVLFGLGSIFLLVLIVEIFAQRRDRTNNAKYRKGDVESDIDSGELELKQDTSNNI